MLTMIDMGTSNLGSVARAFETVGARLSITSVPSEVEDARALILPGVGSFGDAMGSLRDKGLVEPIRRAVLERGVPLLGICVGMQVLAERGEEFGSHEGLGLIPGEVRALPPGPGLRIPNMGWCPVCPARPGHGIFTAVAGEDAFYFAHSYHFLCADPSQVMASTPWGNGRIAAAVRAGSATGVQFHPEKSQDAGLAVLEAFLVGVMQPGKE